MRHLYHPFDTDDITNLLYLYIIIFPLFVGVSNCHVVVVVLIVGDGGSSTITTITSSVTDSDFEMWNESQFNISMCWVHLNSGGRRGVPSFQYQHSSAMTHGCRTQQCYRPHPIDDIELICKKCHGKKTQKYWLSHNYLLAYSFQRFSIISCVVVFCFLFFWHCFCFYSVWHSFCLTWYG